MTLLGQDMVVGTLGPTHPSRYLRYVHDLVRLTTGGSSARLLWPELCTRYQLAYSWREKKRASVASPIQLDAELRRHAITLAVRVLADWPVGVAEALLALDLWGSEHVWRVDDPLWNAVQVYYEANALAACPRASDRGDPTAPRGNSDGRATPRTYSDPLTGL